MRWSHLSLILPSFFFVCSTTAYPVSDTTPRLGNTITKRSTACDGKQNLRTKGAEECRTLKVGFFDWPDAATLKTIGAQKKKGRTGFKADNVGTDIKKAAKLVKGPTPARTNNKFNCDHILELDLVAKILEKEEGVCKQIDESKTDEEKKTKQANLNRIIAKLNGDQNLVFLLKAVESLKGEYTIEFKKGTQDAKFNSPEEPFTILAFNDFITQTQKRSLAVARDIDAILEKDFGDDSKPVLAKWTEYLGEVNRHGKVASDILDELQEKFKNDCTTGAGSSSNPPAGSSSKPSIRRFFDFILGRRATPNTSCSVKSPTTQTSTQSTSTRKQPSGGPTTTQKQPSTKPTTTPSSRPTTTQKQSSAKPTAQPSTTTKRPSTKTKRGNS